MKCRWLEFFKTKNSKVGTRELKLAHPEKISHSMRPCFYERRYIGVTKIQKNKIFHVNPKLPQ